MLSNLNLDYYYGTEEDRFNFYRVPKTLLTDPRYKKEHRVYIYFTCSGNWTRTASV